MNRETYIALITILDQLEEEYWDEEDTSPVAVAYRKVAEWSDEVEKEYV